MTNEYGTKLSSSESKSMCGSILDVLLQSLVGKDMCHKHTSVHPVIFFLLGNIVTTD
jgi:hypothetical protein